MCNQLNFKFYTATPLPERNPKKNKTKRRKGEEKRK
jgi:hypothetical protein